MSAQTDSIPSVPTNVPVSRKQAKRARRAREERDLELVVAAGRGDVDAVATLAERLAPRVERIARALMGALTNAAVDADDAALHALIELLRSHASYRGKEPLERWADRAAALSVVRFGRAVSRRTPGSTDAPLTTSPRRDERTARTFEQYLQTLSDPARQTLLLRHGLGFKLSELADALQCSASSARQQLLDARAELRSLIRRRGGSPSALGVGATRWAEQRDREALGEALRADELEELTQLETRDPEVWAFVAQVRALELYFDKQRTEPATLAAASWVVRAIAALRVTSPPPPPRASGTLESHQFRDLEGSRVIRGIAVSASVLLAASTVAALLVYRPPQRVSRTADQTALPLGLAAPDPRSGAGAAAAAASATQDSAQTRLRPTVEALPKVSTAPHGAELHRDGRLLAPGTLIGQGDLVDAIDRAGCLQIEPDSEACLALGSAVRLLSISARQRQLELTRGRVVVRVGPLSEATRVVVHVGKLEVSAGRAVFGVERAPDEKLVRVRALRGGVEVRADGATRQLREAQNMLFRAPAGFELTPLMPGLAQRDWEVLATLHPAVVPARASPAHAPEVALQPTRADVAPAIMLKLEPSGDGPGEARQADSVAKGLEPRPASEPAAADQTSGSAQAVPAR